MKALFLDATLYRDVQSVSPDIDTYDPPAPSTVEYSCKAIVENYAAGLRAGGLVAATDMRVIVLAGSLDTEPLSLDRISIPDMGFSGTVVPVDIGGLSAVSTDPAKATWMLRCAT